MKFMKKIGDGDVTVKDNEVIETNPMEKAEIWGSEFSRQEVRRSQACFTVFDMNTSFPFVSTYEKKKFAFLFHSGKKPFG